MKESSTYQAIYAEGMGEGAISEARKLLRIQGDDAFGEPDSRTIARIERIDDLDTLEELLMRVLKVTSWQELFSSPRAASSLTLIQRKRFLLRLRTGE
jgi:hypothetical protein